MPRLDQCHEQIVHALQKDGWQVGARSEYLSTEERTIAIDIRASRNANGNREQALLAEVKCFADKNSDAPELYMAIGQYIVYRAMLETLDITTPLYLAVPERIIDRVFDSTINQIVETYHIKMVIVNLDREVIVRWKE